MSIYRLKLWARNFKFSHPPSSTRLSVKNVFHLNQIDSIRRKEKSFFQLFEPIMKTNPEAFEKIVPIEGDVSIVGLGLSDESRERMKGVSVVFHSAASVRFDDELYSAIILNTRGTHEVIKYAVTLSNLVSFVHVSTTYCYPDHRYLDEKVRITLLWLCMLIWIFGGCWQFLLCELHN